MYFLFGFVIITLCESSCCGLSAPCVDNISHEVVEVYYLNVALALFNTGGLLF